jgi:flagellar biosynthetic protein FlhB
MADDVDDSQKTEDPSTRKLSRAREKGQVVHSREVNNWFIVGAGLSVVLFFGPPTARAIGRALYRYIAAPDQVGMAQLGLVLKGTLAAVGLTLLAPLALLTAAAVAGALLQTGFVFAPERLSPDIDNLSPVRGFSRIFSLRGFVEFGKTLAKLAMVVVVAAVLLAPEIDRMPLLMGMDVADVLAEIEHMTVRLGFGVFVVLTLIAALDYGYQRFSFMKSMRMSKQEVKEEHKQSEGDPMVRARLRQIRMERARKRMMAAVPGASVVVTNPTHYAVALKYELGSAGAPRVVAKGADLLALRIREVAEEHDVPIVENPPLARALFGGVELDQEIPAEHYKAVAEIIGFVFRQQGKLRPHPAPPPPPGGGPVLR